MTGEGEGLTNRPDAVSSLALAGGGEGAAW